MKWVPEEGLYPSHFPKFVLDFAARGVDLQRFEAGLTRLMELSGVGAIEDETEVMEREQQLIQSQRDQRDRWGYQKSFVTSGAHRGTGSRDANQRAREPSVEATGALELMQSVGTRLVMIAVEGTLLDDAQSNQLNPSAWELRKKVNPELNELITQAIASGVQVGLASRTYQAKTIQSLSDQLFALPGQSNVIVRCGGFRAEVRSATAADRGGHRAPQKLYAGNGREVIVPGHVKAQPNHKQWNLESLVTALKQKGIQVDVSECMVIDADNEDVMWLREAGYRALLYNKEEGIQNIVQNQM